MSIFLFPPSFIKFIFKIHRLKRHRRYISSSNIFQSKSKMKRKKNFLSLHFLCKLSRTNSSFYLTTLTHRCYYLSLLTYTHVHTIEKKNKRTLSQQKKGEGNGLNVSE